MKIKYNNIDRILSVIAIGMVLSLSVSGCATAPRSSGPILDSVTLPAYEVGTTYIYSDGKWESVMDTSSEVVTWRDYRNYISSGSRDFTRRRTKWETKTRKGTRQFGSRDDLVVKSDLTLWPLRVGNITNYSETGTWFDKDGASSTYRAEWSCEVPGTEQVSVMAGEFDTWKIVCKRYRLSKSKSQSNIREVTTWYFSPEVGHYVLTTSKYYYDKKSRRRELLAVLPSIDDISPEARFEMERSFQQALEFRKSGDSVPWSSQQSMISGEIIPVNTFKTADGKYCRRYVQKLKLPISHRTYYGLAVRGADGVWKVPRR
jgi:hypothetical protein